MSTEELIEIHEIEKIDFPEPPNVLIGVPDVGLVGIISASHLVTIFEDLREYAHVESSLFPPVVVVHKGKPSPPIRIYASTKDTPLLLIVSEIPIPPDSIHELSEALVNWLEQKNPNYIISLGGVGVPNRLEIEKPLVFAIGSNEKAESIINEKKIEIFEEGMIIGPYAALMHCFQKRDMINIALLAQSHMKYPDPGAAASILEAVGTILDVEIDIDALLQRAEEIRLRTRDLMRDTGRTMDQMQKEREYQVPAFYG